MLDMLIYVWHQLPWLGRLAGPVMQFLGMLECMSMPQAVILAGLGFIGPLQWWTFQFVRLWRTSRVSAVDACTAQACDWLQRAIPGPSDDDFSLHLVFACH